MCVCVHCTIIQYVLTDDQLILWWSYAERSLLSWKNPKHPKIYYLKTKQKSYNLVFITAIVFSPNPHYCSSKTCIHYQHLQTAYPKCFREREISQRSIEMSFQLTVLSIRRGVCMYCRRHQYMLQISPTITILDSTLFIWPTICHALSLS